MSEIPDFFACQDCHGEGGRSESKWQTCSTCGGSGRRPLSTEIIDQFVWCHEWLEDRIQSIFDAYCQIYHVGRGGVISWSISGDQLRVTYGWSVRSCWNEDSIDIPSRYLYLDDYRAAIEQDHREDQRRQERRERARKAAQRSAAAREERRQYERLKQKYEGN